MSEHVRCTPKNYYNSLSDANLTENNFVSCRKPKNCSNQMIEGKFPWMLIYRHRWLECALTLDSMELKFRNAGLASVDFHRMYGLPWLTINNWISYPFTEANISKQLKNIRTHFVGAYDFALFVIVVCFLVRNRHELVGLRRSVLQQILLNKSVRSLLRLLRFLHLIKSLFSVYLFELKWFPLWKFIQTTFLCAKLFREKFVRLLVHTQLGI